jgi:hypothetical protein
VVTRQVVTLAQDRVKKHFSSWLSFCAATMDEFRFAEYFRKLGLTKPTLHAAPLSAREVGTLVMHFLSEVDADQASKAVSLLCSLESKAIPADEKGLVALLDRVFEVCPSAKSEAMLGGLAPAMPAIVARLCKELPSLIDKRLRPYQSAIALTVRAFATLLYESPRAATVVPGERAPDALLALNFEEHKRFSVPMLYMAETAW